jgi:hypothetical protein
LYYINSSTVELMKSSFLGQKGKYFLNNSF